MDEKDLSIIEELSTCLAKQTSSRGVGERMFRNPQIAEAAGTFASAAELEKVIALLAESGALDLQVEEHLFEDIDGESREVSILRAALTDTWPMGTHFWVRDNAMIAGKLLLLESNDAARHALAKKLLLSTLTLMSSATQLQRFEKLLHGDAAYRSNPANWSHIFFEIRGNLNAAKDESWTHIQDAWQILAYYVLTALQQEKLAVSDLTEKHRRFLSYLFPLLAALPHTEQENSGSWEELVAVRSSVLIWEQKVLELVLALSKQEQYAFLIQELSSGEISGLIQECQRKLEEKFPYESGEYQQTDPKYREADSALIAFLTLQAISVPEKERTMIDLIETLRDPRTRAFQRYKNDSYQRLGFFRPSVVEKLREYYGAPSGDAGAVGDFVARDTIVPPGPGAAWVHFLFQLSAWAGTRFLETKERWYFDYQKEKLLDGLALITGNEEYTLHADGEGKVEVQPIPAFRIPECYLTEVDKDGDELIFPTPHTPLNWAVGEAIVALEVMRKTFPLSQ